MQFGSQPGARMGKCNYCLDRFQQGKLPNCIEACPVRALDAGPLGKLEELYGTIRETEGFKVSTRTRPAVVFKPKG